MLGTYSRKEAYCPWTNCPWIWTGNSIYALFLSYIRLSYINFEWLKIIPIFDWAILNTQYMFLNGTLLNMETWLNFNNKREDWAGLFDTHSICVADYVSLVVIVVVVVELSSEKSDLFGLLIFDFFTVVLFCFMS